MPVFRVGTSFIGLSTDSKPSGISDGFTFFETDTKYTFIRRGGAWNFHGTTFVQALAPTADVLVGTLWSDTTAKLLKVATSIGPIVFVTLTAEEDDFGLSIILDGGGSVLSTGVQTVALEMPFDGVIESNRLLSAQNEQGAVVVDIWKATFANFPPTVADTITASAKPTIAASDDKSEDSTLTGWTTAFSAGDILIFNIDSVATFTHITLSLRGRKT